MRKEKEEKMLIDMLSWLRTHSYGGFNEIGRFLANKGYSPFYKGGHYSGSKMVHPHTTLLILNRALEEGLINSKHPLGGVPKGKTNRFSLTKKGIAYLEKKWMLRFIENSDIHEISFNLETFEKALLKAEENLDNSAMKSSQPLGPGDKLTSKEDMFLAERNIKIVARKLLSSCKIKVLVPQGFRKIKLNESEVEDLCTLMAGYDNGKTPFSFVLSYDPSYYELETNPKLLKDLSCLEIVSFYTWLITFKNENISKIKFKSLLPFLFGKQKSNSELSKEIRHFKELWIEYETKRSRVDLVMDEIRRFANKVAIDYEKIKEIAQSAEGKEIARKIGSVLEDENERE